jgi:2-amino-4-hydroxy-6-hydroxymethyldihydropteridine diphosphokinase
MAKTSYAVALGSNRRHGRHGAPARVLAAAAAALNRGDTRLLTLSRIRNTAAMGPGGRGFANAAAIVESTLAPADLMARLKSIEAAFGRRGGRRWGPRVLDLDIILWSEGPWASGDLVIPHRDYRVRAFVLEPLAEIAPDWRDPLDGLSVRQRLHRATAPRPVDRTAPPS